MLQGRALRLPHVGTWIERLGLNVHAKHAV